MSTDDEYPYFVTDADRQAWANMSAERQQQFKDAVPYVLKTYPNEQMSVALIGTVLTFGG